MTYDAGLGAVVLFGGAANGIWEDFLNDTWVWNGTNWTEIHPATVPPNRYSFGMNYDPLNKAVFMFGGYSPVRRAATPGSSLWPNEGLHKPVFFMRRLKARVGEHGRQ